MNIYAYVEANPVSNIDPTGLLIPGARLTPAGAKESHGEEIATLCHDDEYKNSVVSAFTPDVSAAKSTL